MNETGKEPAKPPAPAPATSVSATLTSTNNKSGKTIGETEEEISYVETKVGQEDRSKKTSGEKVPS